MFNGQQGSPYRPEQSRDPPSASGQALGVVEDQVGCPTSTATLAAAFFRRPGLTSGRAPPRARPGLS